MKQIIKITLLIVGIVIFNMVLFNFFHVKEYIAIAISVGIGVLIAAYEVQRKK